VEGGDGACGEVSEVVGVAEPAAGVEEAPTEAAGVGAEGGPLREGGGGSPASPKGREAQGTGGRRVRQRLLPRLGRGGSGRPGARKAGSAMAGVRGG